MLGRRAGSIHPLTAALFPVAVVVFVVIVVRSAVAVALGRDVTWKDGGSRPEVATPSS